MCRRLVDLSAATRLRFSPMIRAQLSGHYRDDGRYAAAVVNVTNRCNLTCQHCFIFRDGNPNEAPVSVHDELSDAAILETLIGLRDRHGIVSVLWMGGEPLLRRELVRARASVCFARNTIVTNGTIPLVDFGPTALYVVSLDGPEDLNDAIRGRGIYQQGHAQPVAHPGGLLDARAGAMRRHQTQSAPSRGAGGGGAGDAGRVDDVLLLRAARQRHGPRRLGDE